MPHTAQCMITLIFAFVFLISKATKQVETVEIKEDQIANLGQIGADLTPMELSEVVIEMTENNEAMQNTSPIELAEISATATENPACDCQCDAEEGSPSATPTAPTTIPPFEDLALNSVWPWCFVLF